MDKKIRITLVRSVIGSTRRQRETVKSLGLGKTGSSAVQAATPDILGKVRAVAHLVRTEEIGQ